MKCRNPRCSQGEVWNGDTLVECPVCHGTAEAPKELLSCPFCGGCDLTLDNLGDPDDYSVSCRCGIQQIANNTREEAIRKWNARSTSTTFVSATTDPDMDEERQQEGLVQ